MGFQYCTPVWRNAETTLRIDTLYTTFALLLDNLALSPAVGLQMWFIATIIPLSPYDGLFFFGVRLLAWFIKAEILFDFQDDIFLSKVFGT